MSIESVMASSHLILCRPLLLLPPIPPGLEARFPARRREERGCGPVTGKDWGQEEKGTTEDEVAGCHHRLDGREFE